MEPIESQKISWWGRLKRGERVFAVVLIAVFLFVFYIALDANKYRATIHVIEGEGKVGVNPTTESLDFGDLSRGTSAIRRVTIKNRTGIPMGVWVWKTGGISELMDVSDNLLRLTPGESKRVEFTTYIPASAAIDTTYAGRVYIFKIPTFGIF